MLAVAKGCEGHFRIAAFTRAGVCARIRGYGDEAFASLRTLADGRVPRESRAASHAVMAVRCG
jgi:hypothetical protein